MHRQDYLLRMIQELGQIWSLIVGRTRARLFPQAQQALDQAYQDLLGLSTAAVEVQGFDQLLARVRFGESDDVTRAKAGALLRFLKASGDLAFAQAEDDRAVSYYHQALGLLLLLQQAPAAEGADPLPVSIEELKPKVTDYVLPKPVGLLLIEHYERQQAYDQAENVLFHLLEYSVDAEVLDAGRAFYARLQQLDDEQLAAGELPRPELAAGLAELERYAEPPEGGE
jgi:hypothetical protein